MSKKELLNETQIRRFMTLANLEPLVKNVIKEGDGQMPEDAPDRRPLRRKEEEARLKEAEEAAAEAPAGGDEMVDVDMGGAEDAGGEDAGGEADADKTAAFEAAVKALADSLGIEVEMGDSGEADADAGADDSADMDAGAEDDTAQNELEEAKEEEMDEARKKKAKKEEEEEMDENVALSEDSLVEAVLSRVTARLVAEAKKKKESPKEKMARMKKEKEAAAKKKKALEEATESKGGGPLLKQGKNKHDTYKGHADMEYSKGKEGKGGHELETLSAKAEHSVTHGGKNLATLGGIKKK